MTNFTKLHDDEILQYLIQNFADIEVGDPVPTLSNTLRQGIDQGNLVIEKRPDAFAIIARANRKHLPPMDFIKINPQADLMFLMVKNDARGKGAGRKLLMEVKAKYMEGQAMLLVCAGENRRRYFESLGFRELALNEDGHFVMICESI